MSSHQRLILEEWAHDPCNDSSSFCANSGRSHCTRLLGTAQTQCAMRLLLWCVGCLHPRMVGVFCRAVCPKVQEWGNAALALKLSNTKLARRVRWRCAEVFRPLAGC